MLVVYPHSKVSMMVDTYPIEGTLVGIAMM